MKLSYQNHDIKENSDGSLIKYPISNSLVFNLQKFNISNTTKQDNLLYLPKVSSPPSKLNGNELSSLQKHLSSNNLNNEINTSKNPVKRNFVYNGEKQKKIYLSTAQSKILMSGVPSAPPSTPTQGNRLSILLFLMLTFPIVHPIDMITPIPFPIYLWPLPVSLSCLYFTNFSVSYPVYTSSSSLSYPMYSVITTSLGLSPVHLNTIILLIPHQVCTWSFFLSSIYPIYTRSSFQLFSTQSTHGYLSSSSLHRIVFPVPYPVWTWSTFLSLIQSTQDHLSCPSSSLHRIIFLLPHPVYTWLFCLSFI